MAQTILDPIPIVGVFVLLVALGIGAYEVGYELGQRRRKRSPDDTDSSAGALSGSMLALLAFLLAVTMGMAADRFDTRRRLVLDEATTINTTYLRAGFLTEPYRSDARELLREYVPLRIAPDTVEELATAMARSEEIHEDLWAIAQTIAIEDPSDITALFVESVNEVIDLHSYRVTAGVYARVPDTVIIFLLVLAGIGVGMVGFGSGLSGKRSAISATLMIVALAATITLVVDLDRPREGLIQVSQRAMIELQEKLEQSSD
jgi:hypothetical protein